MTVSRIATENDRLAIFKLAAQMHLETDFRFYDFEPAVAIAGLGDWLGGDPNSVMFVAEADGEIVGMLGATLRSTWFGSDKLASEELFYVAVAHRGSGAAQQLLQNFCDWAAEVGAQHRQQPRCRKALSTFWHVLRGWQFQQAYGWGQS